MVQIHKKSKLVQKEFLETPLYGVLTRSALRQDFMEMLSMIDFDLAEFPAPDGSVELVAEVVTMTKQDYDDLLTYLVCFKLSNDGNQQLLAGEIYRMLTGKSMWA